jgi:hypothetical protein
MLANSLRLLFGRFCSKQTAVNDGELTNIVYHLWYHF